MNHLSNDENTLRKWSFITDYTKHQVQLVELAQDIYKALSQTLHVQPGPADCVRIYEIALLTSTVFQGMVTKKLFLKPSVQPTFAHMLARYVLYKNWSVISGSSTP